MTKSLRFLLAAGALSFAGYAAAESAEPVFKWGNFLTGVQGQDQTQNHGIATFGTDAVYWMATDGSKNGDLDVTYAGQFLYDGSEYDGTSANKNLTLLKTNAAGDKQWVIYSDAGDFISGEGGVVTDADGNVVFFGTVRHTDGRFSDGISLTDASGKKFELGWEVGDRRNNRLFLGTASPEGEIQWIRTYEVSTEPAAMGSGNNADFTADAVNAYALTLDGEGNIYIGGRYRNPLTFPKADGGSVTLTPKNVSTWTGDSQKTVGDLYVVKLDRDGNYLTHLTETGDEVQVTYTWDLAFANGAVYFAGYAVGTGAENVTIGGVTVTPNQYVSPIVAKLDTDLNPEWLKLFPGGPVATKNAVQNVSISVSKSAVWMAGMFNGSIEDPNDPADIVASTQGTLREGFLIKLNQADGEWLGGMGSRESFNQNYLTGYLNVITEDETGTNDVLVYGYAMNATVGVFLRSYDATTLVGDPEKSWNVVTQGGVPTAVDIAYVPQLTTAYMTARGNKAFQPLGGPLSDAISGYTSYLTRFDLPFNKVPTSVAEIANDSSEVEYYTLQGLRVSAPSSPGLYIRRAGSETTKILVRE